MQYKYYTYVVLLWEGMENLILDLACGYIRQ